MKQRIINIEGGCDTTDEVLLQITRDDEGNDILQLSAWHTSPEGGEFYQIEIVQCMDSHLLEMILDSFKDESAAMFANNFEW